MRERLITEYHKPCIAQILRGMINGKRDHAGKSYSTTSTPAPRIESFFKAIRASFA